MRDLRLVATVRNRLAHEDGADRIEARDRFLAAADAAERALKQLGRGRRGPWRRRLVAFTVVMLALIAVAAVVLFVG